MFKFLDRIGQLIEKWLNAQKIEQAMNLYEYLLKLKNHQKIAHSFPCSQLLTLLSKRVRGVLNFSNNEREFEKELKEVLDYLRDQNMISIQWKGREKWITLYNP